MKLIIVFFICCVLLHSCREDLPSPDYPDIEKPNQGTDLKDDDTGSGTPDPNEPDSQRLDVGYFYEGWSSEAIDAAEIPSQLLIFDRTINIKVNKSDVVEGSISNVLSDGQNLGWWGFGILYESPLDLSGWTKINLSLKASGPRFKEIEIALKDHEDFEVKFNLSEFDFQSDGDWHHLTLPLSKFSQAGLDMSNVIFPLILIGVYDTSDPTGSLLIDNYFID